MSQPRLPLSVSAVALDLDGTLLDTADDIAGAVDATLVSLGFTPLGLAVVRELIGQGVIHLLRTALTRAAGGAEPEEDLVARSQLVFNVEYAAGLCQRTAPYPGALAGLDSLAAAGFPLACVTNKPERFTTPMLRALELEEYFALVVSGDTLPVKKPDPGPLLHAGSRLGVPPSRLLLIGDSVHDLRAARSAGCPFFCVTYGYTGEPDALAREADAAFDSLADVARHLILASSVPEIAPAPGWGRDAASAS